MDCRWFLELFKSVDDHSLKILAKKHYLLLLLLMLIRESRLGAI